MRWDGRRSRWRRSNPWEARFGDVGAYQVAQVHAWRGEPEPALDWLDRAYRQRDPGLVQVKYDPLLGAVRASPRYRALLTRMGLPVD